MKPLFILFQYCVPQHLLSRFTGALANSETIWLKQLLIKKFMKAFKVTLDEAQFNSPKDFKSFNDFFTRALKENARPIDKHAQIISPADGSISQMGDINNSAIFQAKNHHYSVKSLLTHQNNSDPFIHGEFITVYLSPSDYHRVHMPIKGQLISMTYVPGDLFSVNTSTANTVPNLFARNERLICIFDTTMGPFAVVLVGAMIVAGIETVWAGKIPLKKSRNIQHWQYKDKNITLNKGDELGRFYLGSTVILLSPKQNKRTFKILESTSKIKMGEPLTYSDAQA